ncbi:SDR family oxidoreductase [Alkalicoccus urumqiensis]|uniref:3-oxoacyl-[acyl-carrier-protein] reductase n=1 Tax=Alkalicoccus urumqiensis TaxID=1548213 RepID=A0A2P6MJ53_ALKUR|nr:SDR family NAD(P)-dependent oxidoreductase [Alkalicoccus urumqiensis]PRO66317.1 3-oxoacyl-[acyl-carrier-protein] reductase [Alkalicoccus urumqiensis]
MNTYDSLKGRHAVITGGGSGMGETAAKQLAAQGTRVTLLDIEAAEAEKTAQAIKEEGGEAEPFACDTSDARAVEDAFQKAVDRFGPVDIVFANAGINGTVSPIEDMEPDEWGKTTSINLNGTFHTVKYAIPHMKENGGSIILTSSVNGTRVFSNFGMSAYSSTKAGQLAFGKMAALELSNYRIRVNVICPGFIKTDIGSKTYPKEEELEKIEIPVEHPEGDQPLKGDGGDPEEVADLVSFLASDASKHITGTELFIDGGSSLL